MKGEELRRSRELLKFSQGEMAERFGISQSQFERGLRPVPAARERQLQRMLGQRIADEERD